jgi:chemotaxis protein CheD
MSNPTVSHRFLALGEFFFGKGHVRVETMLGTCIAITLWNPRKRLGGICHYLLPSRGASARCSGGPEGAYAAEVMDLFAEALRRSRTRPADYEVKLFGGGHMFPDQLSEPGCREQTCSDEKRLTCPSVGCKNICAGRQLLAECGYSILAQDVGGHGSRQIRFDVWSGDVWVRHGGSISDGLSATT